jgi:hypothetical protein
VIVPCLPHHTHAAFSQLLDDGVMQQRPPRHGFIPRCAICVSYIRLGTRQRSVALSMPAWGFSAEWTSSRVFVLAAPPCASVPPRQRPSSHGLGAPRGSCSSPRSCCAIQTRVQWARNL